MVRGLEHALTVLSVRARVLAGNVANADTPAYRRRDVPFYAVMREVLSGREEISIPVEVDRAPPERADGNNTSAEKELAALTETMLLYQAVLQLVDRELTLLRLAVTEGRS